MLNLKILNFSKSYTYQFKFFSLSSKFNFCSTSDQAKKKNPPKPQKDMPKNNMADKDKSQNITQTNSQEISPFVLTPIEVVKKLQKFKRNVYHEYGDMKHY